MKKIFLTFIILGCFCATKAATISVTLIDGIDNPTLKAKMEQRISSMLNEINAAQTAERNLNFGAMGVPTNVQMSMAMLWENCPFMCTATTIEEHCITTGTGYQVRNIPLLMKPTGERAFNEEEKQEASISFNKQGEVESFYLTIARNLYQNVIKENLKLSDLHRRQLILDYVEQFRTAYNKKDKKFLEDIFSDDALIITGRVIERGTVDGIQLPDKIVYTRHNKHQYLKKLTAIFDANKTIHVTFDEIEVMMHPIDANIYGVTLHQGYTSDNYHDDGYLFLLWDFKDNQHPKIHVRTWQPDAFNVNGTGKQRIPKDQRINVNDFDTDI